MLAISDHALLRFLQRAGGLDVEMLRLQLALSLSRATYAAGKIGAARYTIRADGLTYVIRDGRLVTILPAHAAVIHEPAEARPSS